MQNFNWKKFIKATLIFIPAALLIDILYDKLFKVVDFKETFAMKNLFFKVAAALVGAYFFATYNEEQKEEEKK